VDAAVGKAVDAAVGNVVDAAVGKAALRRALLGRRAALDGTALRAAGSALALALHPLLADAAVVALYSAVSAEPPTRPLLEALAGHEVLLPVLRDDGDLDWTRAGPPLVPGLRGTVHPHGPRLGVDAVARCDVVVVPALAADHRGARLGRGGGSYDRALRRARGLVVALLHDGELLERLPEEAHDVRVGAAATPGDGVVRLPAKMLP
jgi:5-formyltetrahydrofolate cyclo-ligase